MGKGAGIGTKRLHVLKSHDALISGADRDVKDAARWEGADERALLVDGEWSIEDRVRSRLNRLIKDSRDPFSVVDVGLTNKDRWGLSWQITPRVLTEALAAGGGEANCAFEAMMPMQKIDIATIEAARRG